MEGGGEGKGEGGREGKAKQREGKGLGERRGGIETLLCIEIGKKNYS